jgi:hypothetical protein
MTCTDPKGKLSGAVSLHSVSSFWRLKFVNCFWKFEKIVDTLNCFLNRSSLNSSAVVDVGGDSVTGIFIALILCAKHTTGRIISRAEMMWQLLLLASPTGSLKHARFPYL